MEWTEQELDEVEGLDVQKHAKLGVFLANVSTEGKMMVEWLNGRQAKLIDESGLSHKHKEILRRGDLHEINTAVQEEVGGNDMYCFVFVRNEA